MNVVSWVDIITSVITTLAIVVGGYLAVRRWLLFEVRNINKSMQQNGGTTNTIGTAIVRMERQNDQIIELLRNYQRGWLRRGW